MTFDDSLSKKLEERTAKAYKSREDGNRPQGITLYGYDLHMLPTMAASFLSDIGALHTGDLTKASAVDLMASCFEEDDRATFLDIIKKKHVDVTFISDFIEYVNDFYSDAVVPTNEPSGSSSTGELTAVASPPATIPQISEVSTPDTPSA